MRTASSYVEGFLQLYKEAWWDNVTLKELFWTGQMLLLGEDHTLWVCGSYLTVEVIEDNINITSDSLVHIPSPAALSLPTPYRVPES